MNFSSVIIVSIVKEEVNSAGRFSICSCFYHLFNPFLHKSNIGKKWLKRFDEFYLETLNRSPTLKDATKKLYLKNIERTKNEIWTSTEKQVIDKTLYIILHNPEVYFHRLDVYAEYQGRISADKERNKKSLGAHAKDNLTSAIVSLFIHNENFRNDHYSTYDRWVKGQNSKNQFRRNI